MPFIEQSDLIIRTFSNKCFQTIHIYILHSNIYNIQIATFTLYRPKYDWRMDDGISYPHVHDVGFVKSLYVSGNN